MVLDLFAIILLQVFKYFGDVKLLSPLKKQKHLTDTYFYCSL